jgi:uncharacterized membrane protein YhaH (DUF805 family)
MIFASIRHNLAGLLRFSGRDSRASFWPYAVTVVLLDVAAMALLMVPEMLDSMARMQRFAVEHPELTTVDSGPGHYSITIQGYHPELMPDMSLLFSGVAAIFVATLLLLAAAVARRLHDRNRSGAWGLLPVPFIAFSLATMPRLFAGIGSGEAPDMRLFGALFLSNALYLVSLALLVVLLAGERSKGPNRFGERAA